jgi:hypothetical protein
LGDKSNYKIGRPEHSLFVPLTIQQRGEVVTLFAVDKRDLIQVLSGFSKLILMIAVLPLAAPSKLNASLEEDAKAVAALDTKYQAAVKANDVATMDQILADDFILVTGRGGVFSKADLIDSARKKEVTYERQTRNLDHRRSECGGTQP